MSNNEKNRVLIVDDESLRILKLKALPQFWVK